MVNNNDKNSCLKEFLVGIFTVLFYNYFLIPLLSNSSSFITFGSEKLLNRLYLDVAKGFHEQISLDVYSLILSFFSVLIIYIFIFSFYFRNRIIRKSNNMKPRAFRGLARLSFTNKYIFSALMVILALPYIGFSYSSLRETFVNNRITYFTQSLDIISPYISEQELLKLKSDFAQIRSQKDYQDIIGGVDKTGSDNKLVMPELSRGSLSDLLLGK